MADCLSDFKRAKLLSGGYLLVTFVGLFHLHTNTNVSSIVLTLDVGVDGFFGDPQEYHLASSCWVVSQGSQCSLSTFNVVGLVLGEGGSRIGYTPTLVKDILCILVGLGGRGVVAQEGLSLGIRTGGPRSQSRSTSMSPYISVLEASEALPCHAYDNTVVQSRRAPTKPYWCSRTLGVNLVGYYCSLSSATCHPQALTWYHTNRCFGRQAWSQKVFFFT